MPTPCQQATYTIHDSDVTSVCSTQPGYQRTSNVFPIRSPLLVADWLIPKVAGKTYVEIGTRDGDIFDCVSPHAKHAIAIETLQCSLHELLVVIRNAGEFYELRTPQASVRLG